MLGVHWGFTLPTEDSPGEGWTDPTGKGYWEWAIKCYPKWVVVWGLQPPLRVSLYPGQGIDCFDC